MAHDINFYATIMKILIIQNKSNLTKSQPKRVLGATYNIVAMSIVVSTFHDGDCCTRLPNPSLIGFRSLQLMRFCTLQKSTLVPPLSALNYGHLS